MLSKPEQPEKVEAPISVTLSGIVMLVSPTQFWNAPFPMVCILGFVPKVTSLRFVHP